MKNKAEINLPASILFWEGTVQYVQDADGNAGDELGQSISISSSECGDGKYFITILRDAERRIMK